MRNENIYYWTKVYFSSSQIFNLTIQLIGSAILSFSAGKYHSFHLDTFS